VSDLVCASDIFAVISSSRHHRRSAFSAYFLAIIVYLCVKRLPLLFAERLLSCRALFLQLPGNDAIFVASGQTSCAVSMKLGNGTMGR